MTDLCRKYYVDSINGSDTNDGLSENSAFASLFAINRLALKPGITYCLRVEVFLKNSFYRFVTAEQSRCRL